MWKYPWGFKEGYVISAGLFLTGILLQLIIGPFVADILQFPVNIIAGFIFVILLIVLHLLSANRRIIRWFSGMEASITSILSFLILVIIMGLIRQHSGTETDGTALGAIGFTHMLSAWAFVLLFVYLETVLGLVILRRLKHFNWKKDIPFTLNHLGLFTALFAGVLGGADMQRLHMIVGKEVPEWRAANDKNEVIELPLALELNRFSIDEYPPKLMIIDNETGETLPKHQPASVPIEKTPVTVNLQGWTLKVTKLLENSAPVITTDSVRYVAYYSDGATAAVFVEAMNPKTKEKAKGWVSCGSYVFPYNALTLNTKISLVMPDREPKRYFSDVNVYTKSGKSFRTVIEVNKPLNVDGWKIYQTGYDEQKGKWSEVSQVELVKDPWLWLVYTGIIMMMCGAVCLFVFAKTKD